VVKEFWQKTISPSCHPSLRQIDSSDLTPSNSGSRGFHKSAPKLHLDRFSCFCVHCSKSPMLVGGVDNPKSCRFPLWNRDPPHLVDGYLGPPESATKRHLYGSAVFFEGLMTVTNIDTDQGTPCVTVGRCSYLTLWCGLIIIIIILSELISPYVLARNLRSSSTYLLSIPTAVTSHFSSRSFSVSAPSTWNSLPQHIRSIDRLSTFKRQLKSHFFQSAFTV